MIRPFQLGDFYLIQRLSRQATRLPCAQTFLQPHSVVSVALSAILPWSTIGAATYVLRQDGHGLVHEGLLQVVRRSNRPEVDILCLAPSIDAPSGHPAIWNKLLSHFVHEAPGMGIERIYADVPEQPLLVSTFSGVGFQPYCRQTVWRHFAPAEAAAACERRDGTTFRLKTSVDDWALLKLYTKTVPEHVQTAEGTTGESGVSPPILENNRAEHSVTYLAFDAGSVAGAIQLVGGRSATWLHVWADMLRPDSTLLHDLIGQALWVAAEKHWSPPLYVASSDFHGGIETVLTEFGFAPFSDRVRMVKHVVKWVRESVSSPAPVVETTSEVVPTSFAPPSAVQASVPASASIDSGNVL